jgi:isoaspartyl peptidase/L-asparaginase-like protein (Ntn-hydrolase superfamily)
MNRRDFIKSSIAFSSLLAAGGFLNTNCRAKLRGNPVVISTWDHGLDANKEAARVLLDGKSALDAVEAGVRVSEADPEVNSVGYGGLPDEDGRVTLDASIMDSNGNAGSVACIENIMHPISVARLVMERSDHVMLVGEGAKRFALAHGFKEENLLTEDSRKRWLEWKEKMSDKDDWGPQLVDSLQTHDTISMLALDQDGNLAGACTTSGLAYKIHGRVGDSPIVGAGMYSDNDVGAAGATGRGEEVIKTCGSFLIVELMRRGRSPHEAVNEALSRLIKKYHGRPDFQVAYIALRKDGEIGAGSIKPGFQYALFKNGENRLYDVVSMPA